MLPSAILIAGGWLLGIGGEPASSAPAPLPTDSAVAGSAAPSTQPVFPANWIGTWTGEARSLSTTGPTRRFEMKVRIAPTAAPDRFVWEITYTEAGKQHVRPYELLAIDLQKGHFVVDEGNSIRLDSYLIGDTLVSSFTVGKSLITASYRVVGETMQVELISADVSRSAKSGGENAAFEIVSRPIRGIQRAELRRRT